MFTKILLIINFMTTKKGLKRILGVLFLINIIPFELCINRLLNPNLRPIFTNSYYLDGFIVDGLLVVILIISMYIAKFLKWCFYE